MPTLHWIGKDKVINHHMEVPFKVLEHSYGFDNGKQVAQETNSGNKIIHGDNLEALKALLPEYEGRIRCIYIDPPYNTGKQTWIYNDNVDDPKIRKWLKQIVGAEGEDLSRHDKWLCMMYPRLQLLHKLLDKDGVIVISIDENEYSHLKAILDEIFGRLNSIGTLIWNNANDNNPTNISTEHEYVLFYAKDKRNIPPVWKAAELPIKNKLIELGKALVQQYSTEDDLQKAYTGWLKENKPYIWPFQDYKFIDKGGIYTGSRSVHNPGKEGYRYDIPHPVTGKPCQQPLMGYRYPWDTMQGLIKNEKIIFGKDENKIVELKLYVDEYKLKFSSVLELDGRAGTNNIKELFPESKRQFDFPKPYLLLEEIFSFVTDKNAIVLDSFAGSGTTAHALLYLNKQDGGNRKFILIQIDETDKMGKELNIAETITAERVKRVINGYADQAGTGGSFDFYELGQPMFLEDGNLNESVGADKIRQYVYYTETQTALERTQHRDCEYFLNKHNDTAYYLYYEQDGTTTLDYNFLSSVKTKAELYVIYADICLLTRAFMTKHNISFKKIPRDIIRF